MSVRRCNGQRQKHTGPAAGAEWGAVWVCGWSEPSRAWGQQLAVDSGVYLEVQRWLPCDSRVHRLSLATDCGSRDGSQETQRRQWQERVQAGPGLGIWVEVKR